MLLLRKPSEIKSTRVELGAGAWIDVVPASSADVEIASAETMLALAGLIEGSEAAAALAPFLGDEFADIAELAQDGAKIRAANVRLMQIHLTLVCQRGWYGIGMQEDGKALGAPDAGSVALLLNDPVLRNKIMNVVNAAIHIEEAEGNGLPALPNGGAGIPDGAPNAGPAKSPAPTGDASSVKTAA